MTEFQYFVGKQTHTFGAVLALPVENTATAETMFRAQGFEPATLIEAQTAFDAACANQTAPAPTPEAGTTDDGLAASALKVPQPDIADQIEDTKKGKKAKADEPTEDQPPADANT